MHQRIDAYKLDENHVKLTKATYNFVIGEIVAVHDLMNIAGVPREINGEKQSMAQRVAYYCAQRDRAALLDVRKEGGLH